MFPRKQSVPSQVVVEKSRHALREWAVVGVISRMKRCGRDAGARFDHPLNRPQPAAGRERPGACGLLNHLSEDKWRTVRSSVTKRQSSLARPSRRPARHTRTRTGPIAAANGFGERVRSEAFESSD